MLYWHEHEHEQERKRTHIWNKKKWQQQYNRIHLWMYRCTHTHTCTFISVHLHSFDEQISMCLTFSATAAAIHFGYYIFRSIYFHTKIEQFTRYMCTRCTHIIYIYQSCVTFRNRITVQCWCWSCVFATILEALIASLWNQPPHVYSHCNCWFNI